MAVKSKVILSLAAVSLVIGGLLGAITQSFAALVAGSFFVFAVTFAVAYYITVRKAKRSGIKDSELEPDTATLEKVPETHNDERVVDPFSRDRMIDSYIRDFHLTREKAENLYDAGYTRWDDFGDAIPEDLLMVEGINPTVARRIINNVRTNGRLS